MTFCIMTLSITTVSFMLSVTYKPFFAEYHYAIAECLYTEFHHAECRVTLAIQLHEICLRTILLIFMIINLFYCSLNDIQ
jgi:hypothetical protein